jgi:hypothetical protein
MSVEAIVETAIVETAIAVTSSSRYGNEMGEGKQEMWDDGVCGKITGSRNRIPMNRRQIINERVVSNNSRRNRRDNSGYSRDVHSKINESHPGTLHERSLRRRDEAREEARQVKEKYDAFRQQHSPPPRRRERRREEDNRPSTASSVASSVRELRLDTRRKERMDRIKGLIPRSDRRVHSKSRQISGNVSPRENDRSRRSVKNHFKSDQDSDRERGNKNNSKSKRKKEKRRKEGSRKSGNNREEEEEEGIDHEEDRRRKKKEWNEDTDLWMTDHIGDLKMKKEQYEHRLLQHQIDHNNRFKGSRGNSHHYNVITGSWSETSSSR